MRHKNLVILLALSFLLLALVGCGGSGADGDKQGDEDSNGQTQGNLVEPSTLITKAEAEAALGEAVEQEATSTNAMGQKICMYSSLSSDRFVQVSVLQTAALTAAQRQSGQTAASIYNTTKASFTVTPMSYGDDAWWGTNGMHILKGDVYVNISVGNTSSAANLEMAKGLAAIASGRM